MGFRSSGPFQPVARGLQGAENILDGDNTEPVEKTLNRVVDVLNGAAMLTSKAEAVAVSGNIFKQVFNLVDNLTDSEAETARKERSARRREAKERKAAE